MCPGGCSCSSGVVVDPLGHRRELVRDLHHLGEAPRAHHLAEVVRPVLVSRKTPRGKHRELTAKEIEMHHPSYHALILHLSKVLGSSYDETEAYLHDVGPTHHASAAGFWGDVWGKIKSGVSNVASHAWNWVASDPVGAFNTVKTLVSSVPE